jgi:ketosteroid isomerase-like protein
MSQENVELVHRVFDAFNRRDLDAMLALIDDDMECQRPGRRSVISWSSQTLPSGSLNEAPEP